MFCFRSGTTSQKIKELIFKDVLAAYSRNRKEIINLVTSVNLLVFPHGTTLLLLDGCSFNFILEGS